MTMTRHVSLVALTFMFAILSVPCALVSASYTYAGKTFDTKREYLAYVQEYLRVWRELHGVENTDTTEVEEETKSSRTTTRAVRSHENFSVRTGTVDDQGGGAAQLNGRIRFDSARTLTLWFEYGPSGGGKALQTQPEVRTRAQFGSTKFDRPVRALTPDTLYVYRMVGENEQGERYRGQWRTFRTKPDHRNEDSLVNVETRGASQVDEDRATLTGTVRLEDGRGGYVWFEYSDEEGDVSLDETRPVRVYPGVGRTYAAPVRGLDASTRYYVRAVGVDMDGVRNFGTIRYFTTKRDVENERPRLTLDRATDVTSYNATLSGSIDMNDFRNGRVFFLYGESREAIAEVPQRYDQYSRIRTDGDNLQKVLVDTDLDRFDEYSTELYNLDLDTRHYYALGVEYENEYNDEVLLLSTIRYFATKDGR